MSGSANADEAAKELRKQPKLLDEARGALPDLHRRAQACGPEAVVKLIAARLLPVYPLADKGEGEWAAFWETYCRALQDLPLDALELAVDAYCQKGAAFFPKPSELFKLAHEHATTLRAAAWRARKACEAQTASAQRRPMTLEERRVERQRAIELGYLKPDGSVNLDYAPKRMPNENPPPAYQTPQAMAARLRAAAADGIG